MRCGYPGRNPYNRMLILNLPIPSRLRPRAIGNGHLEHFLQEQDCAYRMGGFINYAIYIVDSEQENQKLCGAGREMLNMYDAVIRYLSRIQHDMNQSIAEESRFVPDADFAQMKKMAAPIIHSGCHTGDGWLVAAKVADLIEKGYENILIVHPFGCLVSHVWAGHCEEAS